MKIVLLKFEDGRQRHRFISEPLLQGGHRVDVVGMGSWSGVARALLARRGAARPDAVIALGAGAKQLLAFWLARFLRVPFIVRLGGNAIRDTADVARSAWRTGRPLMCLRALVGHVMARLLIGAVKNLFVVNEALAPALGPRMRRDARITVVPQFCEGGAVRRARGIDGPPVLLTVTNLKFQAKACGVLWLVDRLADYVSETGQPLSFRVAGGGLHLSELRQSLAEKLLPPQLTVQLLGQVEDVDAEYARADLFVYRSEHDGTPNVLLEAKRFCMPTLVNDLDAFQSVVAHDRSALVYRDADDFRSLLGRLVSDRALRERLATGAQRDHEARFTPEACRAQLEAALRSAIADPRPAARS